MKQVKTIITILFIGLISSIIYINQDKIISYVTNLFNKTTELYMLGIKATGDLIDEKSLGSLEDSKITGENYIIDSNYYPYYQMLNEEEKRLYKQVCANIESLKIKFIPTTDITIKEVNTVIEAVYNDHPEFFWLNTNYSYKYTEDKQCVQIILDYNETSKNIEKHKILFNETANDIIKEAYKLKSDYDKEKYVHNKIIELAEYDENSNMNQTAYSALITKKTVCAGYTRAFQYLMTKLEIPTYYVVGYANEDHAWNIVKLEDGYYNVDLTWNDQTSGTYNYFNMSDNIFSKTHTRTGMSIYLPKCNGTKYANLESNNINNNYNSNIYIYDSNDSNDNNSNNIYVYDNNDSDYSTNYVIESSEENEDHSN